MDTLSNIYLIRYLKGYFQKRFSLNSLLTACQWPKNRRGNNHEGKKAGGLKPLDLSEFSPGWILYGKGMDRVSYIKKKKKE